MSVALAITYHDPLGRLALLAERAVPILARLFTGIAVQASPQANERTLAVFASHDATIVREPMPTSNSATGLGHARRRAIERAQAFGASHTLLCDADRALFWAERHPHELGAITAVIHEANCTVFGRTPAAFQSHPAVQRETEAIVNRVFGTLTGTAWDVTAAARGLSQRAVAALVAGCADDAISVDVSWPLFLRQVGGFTFAYYAVDGLAFETPDRFAPEIAAAGGYEQWLGQLDASPRNWARRLELARLMMAAMEPYAGRDSGS
jgi:hypothetical protein